MRIVADTMLGSIVFLIATGAAYAQPATASSAAASAPAPATAASKMLPPRNPALTAAENAKEPGAQRPEERVIPQLSVPLRSRNIALPAATSASGTVSSRPGTVDDSAARCLAAKSPGQRAACERGTKASEPSKARR